MKQYVVTLYEGQFIVDADNEDEARHGALATVAEDLSWFVVVELDDAAASASATGEGEA